jgi:hypothetical protein|tara:strand:+ start:268 stop:939 length:672 start_codon:yes stop_codon:yes gene_type:complete
MIKVIDDLIPYGYQKHIYDLVANQDMDFYFHRNVVDPRPLHYNAAKNSNVHAFVHVAFRNKITQSKFFPTLYPITFSIPEKTGVKFSMLDRMGVNFSVGQGESRMLHHLPHIDNSYKHYVAIYYVNDCCGDTFIFEQRNEFLNDQYSMPNTHWDSGNADPNFMFTEKQCQEEEDKIYERNEWTIKHRVTPKMGRLVIFDGAHYHASSDTTDDFRCVINMNLIP